MTEKNEKPKVWEGMVLTVPNRHYECCGKPPNLKAENVYTSYFENDFGEQLVFQYDFEAKRGTLWHGDYSWGEPVPVLGGGTTMTLSREEREWLRLAWRVATRSETAEFQLRSTLELLSAQKAVYDELLCRAEYASKDWQRSLLKMKRRLEKQEGALVDEMVRAQAEGVLEKNNQKEAP